MWSDFVLPLQKILSDKNGDQRSNQKSDQRSQVLELLKKYEMDIQTLKSHSKWNPCRYSRNLILSTPDFSLILVCWDKNSRSPIHNHSGSECYMKCIEGKIVQELYRSPCSLESTKTLLEPTTEEKLEKLLITTLGQGEVCHINDEIGIHRMLNPSSVLPAVTLHLYVPSYQECQIFPKETTESQTCILSYSNN
jgi:cysteine dioxygenase